MPKGLRLLTLAFCGVSYCYGDAQCEPTWDNTCKLKVGIVGGGTSLPAFFHNISIGIGETRRIVAGALNAKPEKALENAKKAGFTGYKHWKDMLEAWRKGDQDLDYVVILTRGKDHYEPTKAFLEAGLAVFAEKPMTETVAEAEEIQRLVESKKVPFVVGHPVVGHPMLMLARELISKGAIGEVRKIESWFNQDWAAEHPGYSWRFDPKVSGVAGAAADVGLHAYAMASWVTGQSFKRVSARLKSHTTERELDESCNVFAELGNGGTAVILASLVAIGFKNEHGLRVFGSKGSLEWNAVTSKALILRLPANEIKVFTLEGNASQFTQPLASYPLDANLANLHSTLERMIRKKRGEKTPEPYDHPGVVDGVQAVRFLTAAIKSSKSDSAWVDV
uniref:Gfo/Idh/MocA-like oxidoreductase N-terminal domain-containing protein n=1 Tax=Alexandrium catenella TaxID=2925 RepID=A0A7S1WFK8_ALECA|mmetsp:Transcript_57265/g.153308  ORF Transcript_57265/g.153308 Transcript_57265/m.153308 type:complete len:392 (+) Transcript_57265:84-1259(+)|eukprot:CAMPEP_0171176678 /NCGR_PEP_ID=MMETSP0790-20130122/11857_1 /TAXON_ID=2925 /ORGANISM="Alexandrium catenella, Strain OF101" /LENGTH=391 /DNA_ID=CAMNT_0011641571 /DNA_START=84 /DNA_END=1259 /DNA_ORIENTATION=-